MVTVLGMMTKLAVYIKSRRVAEFIVQFQAATVTGTRNLEVIIGILVGIRRLIARRLEVLRANIEGQQTLARAIVERNTQFPPKISEYETDQFLRGLS